MKLLKYTAAAVAAILAVCVVVLLIVGQRADAGRVHAAVEIERAPDRVFEHLTEPDKLKSWVSWLVEVKTSGRGVGAKDTWLMEDPNMGGERVVINAVFTQYDPPRAMQFNLSSPVGFTGTMAYKLISSGNNSTRVEMDGHYEYHHWLAKLMEPVVTPQAQKKAVDDLQRLKQVAERTPR